MLNGRSKEGDEFTSTYGIRGLTGVDYFNSTRMDLLNVTADHDRQGQVATDDNVKSHTVVEFASGKGHSYLMTLISSEDSAHDFIVKFSPSMCTFVVASFTREWLYKVLPTMLMEQILLLSMAMKSAN